MADLTSGRQNPVDVAGQKLRHRRLELQIKVMETDIYKCEVDILEYLDQIERKKQQIKATTERIGESKKTLAEAVATQKGE